MELAAPGWIGGPKPTSREHERRFGPVSGLPTSTGNSVGHMTLKTRCWVNASNRRISLIKTETQAS
jgi:hypothetical protein